MRLFPQCLSLQGHLIGIVEPYGCASKGFDLLRDILVEYPAIALLPRHEPNMIDSDTLANESEAFLVQQPNDSILASEIRSASIAKHSIRRRNTKTVTELKFLAEVYSIQCVRSYLEGTSLKGQTYHNAFKWMLTIRNNSGTLMRWKSNVRKSNFEFFNRL